MTTQAAQLLVSVQNAGEAQLAMAGGADWIDVKRPAAGALGMARIDDMLGVICTVADRLPISVALGELAEWNSFEAIGKMPVTGVAAVKVGLAGCGDQPDWSSKWAELAAKLPSGVPLAAVHYADWQTCGSPAPEAILEAAGEIDGRLLLIDTFDKSAGRLFDYMSNNSLGELFSRARDRGMTCAAAGSLAADEFETAIGAGANIVAVRGAACNESRREGQLCQDRVRHLSQIVRGCHRVL